MRADKLTLELDAAQIESCKTCEEVQPKNDQETDGLIPGCLYQPAMGHRGLGCDSCHHPRFAGRVKKAVD